MPKKNQRVSYPTFFLEKRFLEDNSLLRDKLFHDAILGVGNLAKYADRNAMELIAFKRSGATPYVQIGIFADRIKKDLQRFQKKKINFGELKDAIKKLEKLRSVESRSIRSFSKKDPMYDMLRRLSIVLEQSIEDLFSLYYAKKKGQIN